MRWLSAIVGASRSNASEERLRLSRKEINSFSRLENSCSSLVCADLAALASRKIRSVFTKPALNSAKAEKLKPASKEAATTLRVNFFIRKKSQSEIEFSGVYLQAFYARASPKPSAKAPKAKSSSSRYQLRHAYHQSGSDHFQQKHCRCPQK